MYRVTLNTVKDREAAIVGIGIDTNRSGGAQVAWPAGAGVSSPGLDRFVTAWGTGGPRVSPQRDGRPRISRTNMLGVRLENVSRATIDGRRARLSGRRALRVRITADGPGTMRLNLPLPEDARARRVDGDRVPGAAPEVALDRRGATFHVGAGTRTYVIGPAGASDVTAGGEASGNTQRATLDQRAGG